GFSCPNRDGSITTGGCTYCNNEAFHPSYSTPDKTISQQLEEGIEFHKRRYRKAEKYLAYFQPYSNTHAPAETLESRYLEALSHPLVAGVVIGTRPDCVDDNKLDLLSKLSQKHIVIVEYGVESIHDKTLQRINRGHNYKCAVDSIIKTAERGIHMGAHFIFGLPGESREEMMQYAIEINRLPLQSVKFHQLQIVKGTIMEKEYASNPNEFTEMSLPQYLDFFTDFLEILRPDIFIERFAGELPPRFVNNNPWGFIRNVELIRMLEKRLEERDTFQSRLFIP
ncbi:MAG: TIGR01212 family radical SAM protein, partial [Bacteroidales bacterium]|nr:TIGR01212 family radical SAM protein [Bacteroidales bacterium]